MIRLGSVEDEGFDRLEIVWPESDTDLPQQSQPQLVVMLTFTPPNRSIGNKNTRALIQAGAAAAKKMRIDIDLLV